VLHRAQFEGLLWHTKDHTGVLVLAKSLRTSLPHLEQSGGAVVAHACKDHADAAGAADLSYGLKKNVNRWPLVTDPRAIGDVH
jgi:hypothetical protein